DLSAAVEATWPRGTGMPALLNTRFAWYSSSLTYQPSISLYCPKDGARGLRPVLISREIRTNIKTGRNTRLPPRVIRHAPLSTSARKSRILLYLEIEHRLLATDMGNAN